MSDGTKSQPFDLGKAFMERQKVLSRELELPLAFTEHPTAIGDGSEANWVRMLKSFLPGRYEIGPIFALDAKGGRSEQIDLAIFDRQYSPLWFESAGNRFVPVESIYAVFEVKQVIDARTLKYAAKKVASVRRLERTSGSIVDIYGPQKGPDPKDRPILGGILALNTSWKGGLRGETGQTNVRSLTHSKHLDLGLALTDAAFDHVADDTTKLLTPGLSFSQPGTQLIYFALHLFRRLQATGTALAVDLDVYEQALSDVNAEEHLDVEAD